jgi:hypothetical protein
LYLEFNDGSHFEIYADAEMRFTGIIPYDPDIGSIVQRTFIIAKTSNLTAAIVDDTGFSISDPSLLCYNK